MTISRVSLEPSRRCSKGCAFCYNGSNAEADGDWRSDEIVTFALDLAQNGVQSISFGGGEPLEWSGIFDTLDALRGVLMRSLTTNGLPLRDVDTFERLVRAKPEKCHVSIHHPSSASEVIRATSIVNALEARGICAGVNLLVARSRIDAARRAAQALRDAGIRNDRIVYLPMRGNDTPTPEEIATVAEGSFQSMTCLSACAKSERFASVAADRTVAWCSYTRSRRKLAAPNFAALLQALRDLPLVSCEDGALVSQDLRRAHRNAPADLRP